MKKKAVRPPPAGIRDWWNRVDATIPPNVRAKRGLEPRPFTRQEGEAAMKDFYENGFQ